MASISRVSAFVHNLTIVAQEERTKLWRLLQAMTSSVSSTTSPTEEISPRRLPNRVFSLLLSRSSYRPIYIGHQKRAEGRASNFSFFCKSLARRHRQLATAERLCNDMATRPHASDASAIPFHVIFGANTQDDCDNFIQMSQSIKIDRLNDVTSVERSIRPVYMYN